MIRSLLRKLPFLGAVLLVGLGGFSYYRGIPESVMWIPDRINTSRLQFTIVRGIIHIVYTSPAREAPPLDREAGAVQFYCRSRTVGQTYSVGVGVPFWTPAAMLALCTMLQWRKKRRLKQRKLHGLCTGCGYLLAGLPEIRCPECGRPISPALKAHPTPDSKTCGHAEGC